MRRSGTADLPLHYGQVPPWLAERMGKLGLAVIELILSDYGRDEVLRRISDPFWFQSLGAVMGMDWHSSGITTSVMGALKRVVNPRSASLGLYICGGKGKFSRATPDELISVGERTGLDSAALVRCSKLSAKVDNTAVHDGFQLYTHNFVLSEEGNWAVVQQGMNTELKTARRYHWHSANLCSFVDDPHAFVYGKPTGQILNLADKRAAPARREILGMTRQHPDTLLREVKKLVMPSRHDVRAEDIDLKRLGAMLWVAHETPPADFEELLLLGGMGPRTLQSLALVSEVIHGTPSRFSDPARFSFAHGGKDGHPFPVPTKIYDQTIDMLQRTVGMAKLGMRDRSDALKRLHRAAARAEADFTADSGFDDLIAMEREQSWRYGGRTVFGAAKPPPQRQLRLF